MSSGDAGHAGGQAAGEVFDPTTRDAMVSEEVTRITLLRHGEVEQLGERRVRGQSDAELSAHGVEQHARLAAWLRARIGCDSTRSSWLSAVARTTSCSSLCGRAGCRLRCSRALWALPCTRSAR